MKKLQEISKVLLIKCVEKCLQNARELFEEAEILKDNKKYPRAYSLYHLCIEEIGKVFIIFQFLIEDDYSEENSKKFNRKFLDHKTKIKTSRNIEKIMILLMQKELKVEEFNALTYNNEVIEKLNDLKNLSLYCFIDNKIVFKPSDIIGEDEVNLIRSNSEMRLILSEQFCRLAIIDVDEFISLNKEN